MDRISSQALVGIDVFEAAAFDISTSNCVNHFETIDQALNVS